MSGLAADAAAMVLTAPADPGTSADGPAARALQLLEGGRAVLFGQALEIRSDLTEGFTNQHPDLATRLARLRDLLDNSAHAAAPQATFGLSGPDEMKRRLAPARSSRNNAGW